MVTSANIVLDDRDLVRLPRAQIARIERLRDRLVTGIADATEGLGVELDREVQTAIKAIRASGYKEAVIRRRVKRLMAGHYGRLGRVLAGQIEHAAGLAERYSEIMDAYKSPRVQGEARLYSGSEVSHLLRRGTETTRASLAPEVLLSQPAAVASRLFVADRILLEHIKPWREARLLSKSLHSRAVAASEEVTAQVVAAVRESKQLTQATTDLIREVRATGAGEVAQNYRLGKLMRRVERAGRRLNQRGGEEALAEWQAVRRKMRAYMRRLDEGGRVRSSMLELLQRTSDTSAKGIERAIEQHAAFQQKYAAERIVKTETMASYKAEQVLSDAKHDFIVGYIWHMNRSARRGFVQRRTDKSGRILSPRTFRRGGRRRRCVCEELDGKRLSKEMVSGRDARLMAHPHCMCWLEPVFDRRKLDVAQAEDFLD